MPFTEPPGLPALLIEPQGIEIIYHLLKVKWLGLLIEPQGIEIRQCFQTLLLLVLLIEPQGIEILQGTKRQPDTSTFNRTTRN